MLTVFRSAWFISLQSVAFRFQTYRFRNFSIVLIISDSVSKDLVSDSVSDKFGIRKSIGFGIGKNFRYSFDQILGILGDVSVSKLFNLLDSF